MKRFRINLKDKGLENELEKILKKNDGFREFIFRINCCL